MCDAQLSEEERAFVSIDPRAEKYYNISPYAYVANNPINAIDPTGEEISFGYEWEKDKKGNYVINEQGGRNLTGITMHVTGKVINVSSGSVSIDAATSAISSRIESAFKGEIGNGVAFNTVAHLSVANSMNDVSASDHVFALADMSDYNGNTVPGASNQFYGKVAFIDADYFRGPWDRTIGNTGATTAAHELGHLTGLFHSGGGLMTQGAGNNWFIYKTKLSGEQLNTIHNNRGSLNQGSNSEIMHVPSPSAGGYIRKSMPNRGQVRSLVKYPYASF
ncbi:MAG: hypothetical protein LBG19_11220 [Prevotellaceae bacterium]|nr:hypothetical protein [Prevotellaceae bacterium]